MTNYAQKYNATRFDPSNPNDVMADQWGGWAEAQEAAR